jgi:hypothetical protein
LAKDNETQAIERATAEAFLTFYNAENAGTFRVIRIAGAGESPDVYCEDADNKVLNIEVTMSEDNPRDIQALLGRSEHKSIENLREAGYSLGNVKDVLIQSIRKKFRKRYGSNIALVVRDTSRVDWNWDWVLPEVQKALASELNPFDLGVWLLSSRLFRVF